MIDRFTVGQWACNSRKFDFAAKRATEVFLHVNYM